MRTAGIVQECMGQKGSRPEFVNPPHVKPPLKAELSLSVWLFCLFNANESHDFCLLLICKKRERS
eukprot:scaffold94014_cov20-Tisochrysis_lutea.AAC.1